MNNLQKPVARKQGLVVQEMPEEVLIYDLDTNKAHCLNNTAAFVWKSCNGENSVSEIAGLFEKESGNTVKEDLIWLAIEQLAEKKLLDSEIQYKFNGQTRREVLKKIGFASMVALPVVSILAFPNRALAATCAASVCSEAANTGGCVGGQHCCRGVCTPFGVPCSPVC